MAITAAAKKKLQGNFVNLTKGKALVESSSLPILQNTGVPTNILAQVLRNRKDGNVRLVSADNPRARIMLPWADESDALSLYNMLQAEYVLDGSKDPIAAAPYIECTVVLRGVIESIPTSKLREFVADSGTASSEIIEKTIKARDEGAEMPHSIMCQDLSL